MERRATPLLQSLENDSQVSVCLFYLYYLKKNYFYFYVFLEGDKIPNKVCVVVYVCFGFDSVSAFSFAFISMHTPGGVVWRTVYTCFVRGSSVRVCTMYMVCIQGSAHTRGTEQPATTQCVHS